MIDPRVIHESAGRGDEVYPYAAWMPIKEAATQGARGTPAQFIFHSEAGAALTSLDNLWRYVNRDDITIEPHFILDMDGRMAQLVGITTRADNNAKANVRAVSVETQDNGAASLVTLRWSEFQAAQLAGVTAWCHLNPKVNLQLVPCARWDTAGYGPHSKFPEWSVYVGKTCPGQARTAQIPEVIARAKAIVDWTPPIEVIDPIIPPMPLEEDMDMAFIIQNRRTGQPALVYGDGKVTGLAGSDLAGYVARFGEPLLTDDTVFLDFASKPTK